MIALLVTVCVVAAILDPQDGLASALGGGLFVLILILLGAL